MITAPIAFSESIITKGKTQTPRAYDIFTEYKLTNQSVPSV
jgi:hypothetical protein